MTTFGQLRKYNHAICYHLYDDVTEAKDCQVHIIRGPETGLWFHVYSNDYDKAVQLVNQKEADWRIEK